MEFRNYIKKQRNNLGFTQAEIAEKLHVTRQTISNWEQGKAYNAFSVFKGLFFIMDGLFFLLTNYLVDYNSLIVNFCTFSFLITFAIAILYGEHVKPFFLGMSNQAYRQKGTNFLIRNFL